MTSSLEFSQNSYESLNRNTEESYVSESDEESELGSAVEDVSVAQTPENSQSSDSLSDREVNSPDNLSTIDEVIPESSTADEESSSDESKLNGTVEEHVPESEASDSESSRPSEAEHLDDEIIYGTQHEFDSSSDEEQQMGGSKTFSIAESVESDDNQTIFSIQPQQIPITEEAKTILKQIEDFFLEVVMNLANGRKITISVQNQSVWSNCVYEEEKFSLLPISTAKCRNVKSPFKLSVIFYVLREIHEMLQWNRKCTMRELYYKDVTITQSQENVAEALKTICCLLDKTPWQLGVMSSSKGLISGPLQIELPERITVDCGIHKTGMTLPHFTADIVSLETTAEHVLVVEKDTVFKKLVLSDILERWKHKCILITGKGYPDMNTRLILKKLFETYALPINILTDADPYGIEIMLTYRHGSLSMSNLSESLAVPSIRWLGIFPSDIKKFGIKAVPLTEEDKRKLQHLLDRPFINDHVHRELSIMKQINLKAEIEGISGSSCSYLIDVYLRDKMANNSAI